MKKTLALVGAVILTIIIISPSSAQEKGFSPLGYPWLMWGEVSRDFGGDFNEGAKVDGYAEQGIDWVKIGPTDWVLNTFVGARFVFSDQDENYWDNKIGPWVGVKAKHDFQLFPGSWGTLAFGVRGEFYEYTSGNADSDVRGVVFLQWSAGGDWKK